MATNFPTSLDSLVNPTSGTPRNQAGQVETEIIANANDAIEALQSYVGVVSETDENTIIGKIKKLDKLSAKGDILVRTSSGYDRLPVGTNGYQLVADSAEATGLKYIATTTGGTVTDVAITTANGFAGTVATSTTTPEITLTTSVTGLLKGNGTAISAATAGTDYYAPSGTDIAVADGGTGASSFTAYGPVFGGTTGAGALQSVSPGTAGQILTSNGASALPTFQNPDWVLVHSGTLTNITNVTTYTTGTLTSYDRYRIYIDLTGTATYEPGMQFNGNTGANYKSTLFADSSIFTTGSTTGVSIGQGSTVSAYRMTGEIDVVATSGVLCQYTGKISASGGYRLLDGYFNSASNITSFQFFRFTGANPFSGFIRIYGKNN